MEIKYHTNSHSKYLIKYHFVIAVKYRKKLLIGNIKDNIIQIIIDVCAANEYIIDEIQSDIDHLHILIDAKPKYSPLQIIHKIKQISTFRIYQKYGAFLKTHFWKENTFWSNGYFVCSTGNASSETIKNYIANQG